jgi:hypothetical protein
VIGALRNEMKTILSFFSVLTGAEIGTIEVSEEERMTIMIKVKGITTQDGKDATEVLGPLLKIK